MGRGGSSVSEAKQLGAAALRGVSRAGNLQMSPPKLPLGGESSSIIKEHANIELIEGLHFLAHLHVCSRGVVGRLLGEHRPAVKAE